MTHYYGTLVLECDASTGTKGVVCSAHLEIKNVNKDAPYLLEREAIKAGWYLPINGKTRCPKHHAEEAARWGLNSLYEQPVPVGISKDAKVRQEAQKQPLAVPKRSTGTK